MVAGTTDEVRARDHIGENELGFFSRVARLTGDELTEEVRYDIGRHASTPSHLRELARIAAEGSNRHVLGIVMRLATQHAQEAISPDRLRPDVERAKEYVAIATETMDELGVPQVSGDTPTPVQSK